MGTDPLAIFGTELFLRIKARGTRTHKGGNHEQAHGVFEEDREGDIPHPSQEGGCVMENYPTPICVHCKHLGELWTYTVFPESNPKAIFARLYGVVDVMSPLITVEEDVIVQVVVFENPSSMTEEIVGILRGHYDRNVVVAYQGDSDSIKGT